MKKNDIDPNDLGSNQLVNIKIKSFNDIIFNININIFQSVKYLKEEIFFQSNLPPEDQNILFNGKILDDDWILFDLKIEEGSVLYLLAKMNKENIETIDDISNGII